MDNYLADVNKCTIAIIGLGYVGLPLAVEFAKTKYHVKTNEKILRKIIGFDLNIKRINELENGIDKTKEVPKEILLEQLYSEEKTLKFTLDKKLLINCDVFIVTVPTPVDKAKKPDLGPIKKASKTIGEILKYRYQNKDNSNKYTIPIVIFESTVFPGATEEICVPIIEKYSELEYNTSNENSFACGYSPERINPGDKKHDLSSIVKVTSGSNELVKSWIDELYCSIIKAGTFSVKNIKVAEAAKVIENTQRDLNIALINELSIIFSNLKIDTLDVLEAAGTKWNFLKFKPGLVGGHCIGVDPYYLTYKSQQMGYIPKLVLAGRKINDEMSKFIVDRSIQEFFFRGNKNFNGDCLLMGLTFKENCPDIRNTKAIDIYKILNSYGFEVDVLDPCVDPQEAQDVFNIKVINEISKNKKYLFIFVVVSHKQFYNIPSSEWAKMILPNGLIVDIKGLVPRNLNPLRI